MFETELSVNICIIAKGAGVSVSCVNARKMILQEVMGCVYMKRWIVRAVNAEGFSLVSNICRST